MLKIFIIVELLVNYDMRDSEIIDYESTFNPKLYSKKDFIISHGKGALVYDTMGKEYIDCVGGHGVANIGHSHPKLINAIKEQVEKLTISDNIQPNEARAELLKKLEEITPKPLTQSFLTNSGTEAVECAIKIVLANNRDIKNPEIISMKRAFHGRTLGSLSLTFNMKYRKPFIPFLNQNVKFASFGNIESVRELVTDNTVAIICEMVQGEGGVYPAPNGFPKQLRELCDEKDIIFIIDEVQTGFGRTGKMFAFENYNVIPDIMCVAKSLGGGLPIGATISTEDLFDNLKKGEHYSTFGGNPVACAAANAVIDVLIDEKLPENAKAQGDRILIDLHKISEYSKIIRDVRGLGLMIGIESRKRIGEIIKSCESKGLMLLIAGLTVLRMLPPLVINDQQVDKVLEILRTEL